MTQTRSSWIPDPESAAILAAYRRTRESTQSVYRRALRLLAQADNMLDTSGRIRNTSRPIPGQGKRL